MNSHQVLSGLFENTIDLLVSAEKQELSKVEHYLAKQDFYIGLLEDITVGADSIVLKKLNQIYSLNQKVTDMLVAEKKAVIESLRNLHVKSMACNHYLNHS